ncbi:two-component system histidine kinase PnpS [Effusibacillus lacus]|uniref:histidine kinase n=1 Tax=Effusibacillus lacus TaxID=1348429 RepID=A0A292YIF1_9BACL|nr:ATP-binding protein [Effusibacillus lacus]TCS69804.1 two-component system phosphate regulon sensor histidine kinase PhoR [Effusibacillus lacus]GAX88886.1 PAS domain-containing sensor histidine kinase [Effusibacillus lacus]
MKGIRGRITFTYMILIVVTLLISGVYILQFIERVYMENLKKTLIDEAKIVANWVSPYMVTPDSSLPFLAEVSTTVNSSTGKRITVYDRNGKSLYDTHPGSVEESAVKPEVQEALNRRIGSETRLDSAKGSNSLFVAVPIVDGETVQGAVRVGIPLNPVYKELGNLWVSVGISLLAVAVISSVVGMYFASGIARPIEEITRVTRQIARGAFTERVRYRSQDELGVLGESVNLMADRISDQFEDLTQEKSKLEGIIASMESGVMVVDRSGRIQVVNQATKNLLSHSGRSLLGQWHWEVGRSYGLSSMIDEVLVTGDSQRKEITLMSPADTSVELYATPIKGKNDSIVGAVVVLHDVSKWRRVEQMRTEFVANVSHELRTPITAVKGFAETLLDGALEHPDMRRQFIKIIYEESDRLSRLVNDLLELSRIESGHVVMQFEPCEINELVRTTVDKLVHQAGQNGLVLESHPAGQPVYAEVARDRVSQVLINLIGNAIAYTPEGGRIDVTVEDGVDQVIVRVKDTGIGIPQDDLPRLFERFYRVDKARARRSGGTGLGLAIVKHIVEAHKGKVWVDSYPGRGSTFSFTLPKRQGDE